MYEEEYQQEEDPGVIPARYAPQDDYEFSSQARRAPAPDDDEPPEYLPPEYLARPATVPVTAPRAGELRLNERGEPPEYLTPDELMNSPGVSSRFGAFGRGAAEGVIPGMAGMGGGILAGAGTGALIGAAGANPFTVGAGALFGGVVGGIGAGYMGSEAQEWLLNKMGLRADPESMFSARQKQADVAQFPYSRFAGEMTPALATLRPGGTWGQRAASGVIGGGVGAAQDYYQTGEVDPWKVGMGVAAGAALPNINRPTSNVLSRVVPQGMRPYMPNYEAPPPPEPPPPPPPPPRQLALPAPEPYQRTPLPYEVTPAPEIRQQLPSPERVAAVESLDRQIETARLNRDQHPPGDMIGLHDQWSAHHDSLVERRHAMLHGKADAGTEASTGLGGPTPTRQRMDQFNDATTVAAGNSMVNRPPPEDAGIGMGPAAAGNKAIADGAVDESKAAVRTAPGAPTQPSTPVIQGHAAPDIALAAKAAQPEVTPARAAPPAAPPPVAPAATPPSAVAARPAAPAGVETTARLPTARQQAGNRLVAGVEATKAGGTYERLPPSDPLFGINQQLKKAPAPPARPVPEPRPAPSAEPAGIHPQEFANRLLRAAKGDPAEAVKFLDASVARDPALAQGLPVREARELLVQRAATAPVTPPAAQAAIRGERPPGPRERLAESLGAATGKKPASWKNVPPDQTVPLKTYGGTPVAKQAREAEIDRRQRAAQPTPGKNWTELPAERAPAARYSKAEAAELRGYGYSDEQIRNMAPDEITAGLRAARANNRKLIDPARAAEPVVPVAKRPTLTLPAKKETIGQKLTKAAQAAKKLATEEKGSLSIGPFGRRPTALTKEQATKQLAGRYWPSPGMRPHEIANVVTTAAEGDARYALTLLNRRMTEHKGWALRQDIVKARDILFKQAEKIEMRPEPSPEVPVVPGKTRADLQPRKSELIPTKREYTPPGKRTQMVITDTGEVREPKVFREEPKPPRLHGLDQYTPEERGAFIEALDRTVPKAQHTEALARTLTVPKEKVLANLKNLGTFLEQARTERTLESRKTATGAKAANLQDKAHKEGILAAHETAYAANPRPVDRVETLGEARARAERIVKTVNEEVNKVVAQLTRDQPKSAARFTGAFDTTRMANPPPATKVVDAARALLRKPNEMQKAKFDAEEVLALAPETEQRAGGLTGGETETSPETLAGPRYEARVDPDSPTFTSDHKDLTDMLNGMSDRAHAMMEDAWGESIAAEVATTKNPGQLKTDLLGALIDAQDKQNKYAHALPETTAVKTTPVSDRAGIARVEQTGRFKPTKEVHYPTRAGAASKGLKLDPETRFYKDIADQALKFFRHFRGDEKGSLDVTKIFSWIDKQAKKFRPDREPMVPTGMTRLYRAESRPESIISEGKTPDWVKDTPEYKGVVDATGRWFTADREELAWYTNFVKANQEAPITKYVDVPTAVVDQYRVDNLSGAEGKAAQRFSRRWDKEFFLPREMADRRVAVEPEDAGFVDHLRRLWADESGALDVTRMPAWIPTAGAKFRNMFARGAAPATQEYHDQLAARKGASAMGEKIALDWNVRLRTDTNKVLRGLDKLLTEAVHDDGKVPSQAASKLMGDAYAKNSLDALPPRERKFWDEKVAPFVKKQLDLFNEVSGLMTEMEVPGYKTMPKPVNLGKDYANYLPRMPKREINADEGYDPRFNRRDPLSMWKDSVQDRGWQTEKLPNGERQLLHITEAGDLVPYRDGVAMTSGIIRASELPAGFNPLQAGSKLPGKRGIIDHATREEVIAHGRDEKGRYTENSYEQNPMMVLGNSINDLAYLRSRLLFMKKFHTDPEYAKYVTTDRKVAAERWGEGNIKQTKIPQLERNWYPKAVARAFDDTIRQGFDYGGNQFMEKVSRAAQSSLKPFYFIGPEVHVLNELDKLLIGRGYDNLNPAKTMRNFQAGLREVRSQGPMTELYEEAGGNPMFLHAKFARFVPNMARRLGVEIQEKHWKLDPLFKAFGINTKAKYWEPNYQGSNKMMWWQSDVLGQMLFHDNLDRHGGGYKNWNAKFAELEKLNALEKPTAAQVTKRDELAAWRMDLARKAVKETEKIIDNYVVPTTFIAENDFGRGVQQALTDPATANFGRFSHGLIKTLINIGKNMIGQNENMTPGASAALGFSQAAMLLGMANIIYPLLSKAYQQAPWAKPESEVEKRGITSVATIPSELYHKGIKDSWAKVARRAWSPSVPVNLGLTAYENRDNVGRPIMESAGPGGWGAVPFQAAGHVFDQIVSPAGQVSRAYAQGGAGFAGMRFLESNFGVKTPSEAQVKYEQQRPRTEARQGKSRERHPRGVFDILGNEARKLVRGYEKGGPVTATATDDDDGVIPTRKDKKKTRLAYEPHLSPEEMEDMSQTSPDRPINYMKNDIERSRNTPYQGRPIPDPRVPDDDPAPTLDVEEDTVRTG